MSAFATCCGFYCAMTALVGIYFFIILAIMEWRKNPFLTYEFNKPPQDYEVKATAFMILAGIEAALAVLCFICG